MRVELQIIITSFLPLLVVWCKRTTSNTDNFYFDDIILSGNTITDNDAPQVSTAFVKGPQLIEIQYNEPVTSSAEQITNYNLNFNNGNPLIISLVITGLELLFNNPFISNDTLIMDINNIEDLSGNLLDTTIKSQYLTLHLQEIFYLTNCYLTLLLVVQIL